jgi:hypothetical protein
MNQVATSHNDVLYFTCTKYHQVNSVITRIIQHMSNELLVILYHSVKEAQVVHYVLETKRWWPGCIDAELSVVFHHSLHCPGQRYHDILVILEMRSQSNVSVDLGSR